MVFDCGVSHKIDNAIFTAHGPVITDTKELMYIGAQRKSNNTGEISGIIEALMWLAGQTETIPIGCKVRIWSDSSYVVGIANGKFRAKENVRMSYVFLHFLAICRSRYVLDILWGSFGSVF